VFVAVSPASAKAAQLRSTCHSWRACETYCCHQIGSNSDVCIYTLSLRGIDKGLCEYVSTRNDLGHETLALQFSVPYIPDWFGLKFTIRGWISIQSVCGAKSTNLTPSGSFFSLYLNTCSAKGGLNASMGLSCWWYWGYVIFNRFNGFQLQQICNGPSITAIAIL
jgi:hypothetical protein